MLTYGTASVDSNREIGERPAAYSGGWISDKQNARIEHDSVLKGQVTAMLRCNTELYKKYTEDQDFQEWLNGRIFLLTYQKSPPSQDGGLVCG